MSRRRVIRALQTAAAVALLALAGCTASTDSTTPADSPGVSNGGATDSADGDTRSEDKDRPLGSDDDIIVALKAATKATSGEWQGDTLVLNFNEGSKDHPTATINCSAVNRFLTSDKSAVLNYPDGQLSCADIGR